MPYLIVTADGSPLCDLDGKPLFVETRQEARACLKPGETIMRTSLDRVAYDPPAAPNVLPVAPLPMTRGDRWSERIGPS